MKFIRPFVLLVFLTGVVSPLPSGAQTIIKTPAEAAQGFYKAWSGKSRKRAQGCARAEAVDKLFGVRRQKMTFKGCSKREEGDYECIYENKRLDLTMAMIVQIYRVGYRVAEVSFSSEAI